MYCCTMCGDDGQYCRSSAPDTANFCWAGEHPTSGC
jgi:hypothetical protein